MRWIESEGSALPLGATWCKQTRAWNFSLYSKHAEQVTLLLYGADDFTEPILRHTMEGTSINQPSRVS
jgi:glycogen operon protein